MLISIRYAVPRVAIQTSTAVCHSFLQGGGEFNVIPAYLTHDSICVSHVSFTGHVAYT